jgi:hypothetical protein
MHGHSVAFRRATWKNMQTISIDFFFEKKIEICSIFFHRKQAEDQLIGHAKEQFQISEYKSCLKR